jgi:hypothetical protein
MLTTGLLGNDNFDCCVREQKEAGISDNLEKETSFCMSS